MGLTRVQLSAVVRGLFLGGVMSFTAACHQGGGTVAAPLEKEGEKPNFENCDPKFVAETQELIQKGGGAGPLADNAKKTEWVESDFFKKPYDRYDIEAILDIPTVSTAMYVKSLGVSLYKVPRAELAGLCPMYFYLPAAPAKQREVWTKASGGATNGMSLAGLYFEFCGNPGLPGCHERNMVNPTILVDEATDRWTLVHEMMHYNFNQGRKAAMNLPPDSYLMRAINGYGGEFEKAYESFKQAPNRGDLTKASRDLRKVVELGREIFVRQSLEEVAIEGFLIDLWAAGQLRNVETPQSSIRYMQISRDQFIATLGPLEELAAELKKAAEDNFWPENAAEIEETIQLISAQRAETKAMIDNASAKFQKMSGIPDNNFPQSHRVFFRSEDEEDFNSVSADSKIYAHLASHDRDGLQASFTKLTQKLASQLDR